MEKKKGRKKRKKWDRAGKQGVAEIINSRGTGKTSVTVLIEFSIQIYMGKPGSFKE